MWGAESQTEMEEILSKSFCVRFDFHSGGPGYVGDLFILYGDALVEEPPVALVRNKDDELVFL